MHSFLKLIQTPYTSWQRLLDQWNVFGLTWLLRESKTLIKIVFNLLSNFSVLACFYFYVSDAQNSHWGPFLPPCSSANRKRWEMQCSEGIHREFQPSSFVVQSCYILVHLYALVGRLGWFTKVLVIIVRTPPRLSMIKNLISSKDSKAHATTGMNNSNNQAQSYMVMRLYFQGCGCICVE